MRVARRGVPRMAPPSRFAHGSPAAYAAESRALCWRGAVVACVLAIILVPAFCVLDAVACPEHFRLLLGVRLGCVVILAGILGVLHTRWGRRRGLGLGLAIALVCGFMIDGMTTVTGGAASPYYAGVNLVMVAVALLMPWPPRWALLTCVMLIGCYAGCLVVVGSVGSSAALVSNLCFLVANAVITVVSAAVRDRLRWREFSHRTALADAVRHKSDFMARMSHELRTPVHVMIGYADILLEEQLAAGGAGARELVGSIRRHATLLHRMISDLLDYAKIEAGKMDVRVGPVDLAEVVREVAEGFRPLADRKGVALGVRADAVPAIATDREKVEQIVRNLVANAVKFTETGAVTVEVRPALDAGEASGLVFVDAPDAGAVAPPARTVAILVRDTGIGIRRDKIADLAADFQQVDAAAAARYGGTGLGLSISKRLVALLGGRIAVRSRYREGSTFVVFLPATVPAAHAVSSAA